MSIDIGYVAGTGLPSPEKYRYYVCELKWNTWECNKKEHPNEIHQLTSGALASKLIPIDKRTPKILDPLILSLKTRIPVKMRTW